MASPYFANDIKTFQTTVHLFHILSTFHSLTFLALEIDCNYPRTKKQKLIRHMKRVHMKIKDFKCEQCGYTCSKKQYLDRHIKHAPIQIKGFIP